MQTQSSSVGMHSVMAAAQLLSLTAPNLEAEVTRIFINLSTDDVDAEF